LAKEMNDIQSINKQQGMEHLYTTVKEILANARKRAYSAVNFAMVESYWLIGQQIVEHEQRGEARADYGKGLLKELAAKLTIDFGKGFDESNLRYMRLFYRCFPIRDTLRHELTWSHYRRLISVEDEKARLWYMNEAADSVWSTRQMDRQISTLYYERLLASREKVSVVAEAKEKLKDVIPSQFIHDPFVLEFLDLKDYPAIHESDIEQALIDHLQQFLLELGRGFCFVGRQRRMRYDDEDFYVDLVFYHRILKCHVLVDLKASKIKYDDIAQMNLYLSYYKKNIMQEDDNPPVGILMCTQAGKELVEYAKEGIDENLFVKKYKLALPKESELTKWLKKEVKDFGGK